MGLFLYNSKNEIEKSWERFVNEAEKMEEKSVVAKAKAAAFELIKHPHHFAGILRLQNRGFCISVFSIEST